MSGYMVIIQIQARFDPRGFPCVGWAGKVWERLGSTLGTAVCGPPALEVRPTTMEWMYRPHAASYGRLGAACGGDGLVGGWGDNVGPGCADAGREWVPLAGI